jgi:hypothetical protein
VDTGFPKRPCSNKKHGPEKWIPVSEKTMLEQKARAARCRSNHGSSHSTRDVTQQHRSIFDATKARTIHLRKIEIIVSLQRGNVIEFPCFRLKHAFEFHSVV